MRRNNLLPKRFSGNNFTKYFLIDHHLSCRLTQCQTSDFCYYSLSEYQYFYISPGNLIAVPILKSQWLNTINVFLLHITVQSELVGSPPSSDPGSFYLWCFHIQHAASKLAAGGEAALYVQPRSADIMPTTSHWPEHSQYPTHCMGSGKPFFCVSRKTKKTDLRELW